MKDFTTAQPRVEFRLDGHIYHGISAMPAEDMVQILDMLNQVNDNDMKSVYGLIQHVARQLLDKPSADTFVGRMASGADVPVDFAKANEVAMWLMEQYGGRPTQQPNPSGVGLPSPTSGLSLTGSTPDVVSTSSPSPGTDS